MVQEMELDITTAEAGVSPEAAAAPTKMQGKTTFAFTQKTGNEDKQGNTPADVTYDQITVERSMNGKPMPGDKLGENLVGKTANLIYDKSGRIIDVKIPPETGLSPDSLKEMMSSMIGLPERPLAVGEASTMPFTVPLPIPSPGSEPLRLQGEAHYKLVEIVSDGNDKVARFEQIVEAALNTVVQLDLPSGPAKIHLSFKLTGGGGLQLNLDKGVVTSGDIQSTIDGNMYMTPSGSDQKLQNMTLHGTTRTSARSSR
jgi:hypothetical protein